MQALRIKGLDFLKKESLNRVKNQLNIMFKLKQFYVTDEIKPRLVRLIYCALQQRERDRIDEKDWVLLEAMSGKRLQNGGTFRNVLARRIDEAIKPYFTEIIAHIDQNCNLDLLDPTQSTPISIFWLALFRLTGEKINFSSPSVGKTTMKTDFHCQLPFSWKIREVVDAQRTNTTGLKFTQLYDVVCNLVTLYRVLPESPLPSRECL